MDSMNGQPQSLRYPGTLLAMLAVVVVALGIAPTFRQDWLLENLLVLIAVPVLVATSRRLRFSNAAYTCLCVFFVLHEVGAHYTYSLVPYDAWFQQATGVTLNSLLGFERNHFDRLLHFLYGLLITPATVEVFAHYGRYGRSWSFLLPMFFMAGHSTFYELVEWAAAMAFGGELGVAYLGTQGDIWDAQKDMALALAGTVITLVAYAIAGRLPIRR